MAKVLLVGINKYQLPGNDLRGCVNDVLDMRAMLNTMFGIPDGDIRVLTDGAATKQGIMAGLEWLVTSGDTNQIFHYSGHGTQVYDPHKDENDGLDEALCPSDLRDANTVLTDDAVAGYIKRVPTEAKFTFIADCCHSGTINRGGINPHYRKPKYMVIPGHNIPHGVKPRKEVKRTINLSMNLLLSACRDTQTAADAEFGGRPNGALTYFMLQVIRSSPRISWRQLHARTIQMLYRNGYDQVPQLSGPSQMITQSVFI